MGEVIVEDYTKRFKPWFHYTGEEKSFVVFNAYQKRVLKSEEIKEFLSSVRLHNVTTFAFPFIFYPVFKLGFQGAFSSYLFRKPSHFKNGVPVVATAFALVAWINHSPFYKSSMKKRENLLELIEQKISLNVKDLNDVIPRFWTETEIHRKTQQLFNERNGLLVGILYPYEESAEPLVDLSSFPKQKIGKNTK